MMAMVSERCDVVRDVMKSMVSERFGNHMVSERCDMVSDGCDDCCYDSHD